MTKQNFISKFTASIPRLKQFEQQDLLRFPEIYSQKNISQINRRLSLIKSTANTKIMRSVHQSAIDVSDTCVIQTVQPPKVMF